MLQAAADGSRVFPIAWHVDYWDFLGWQDPFAHAEFTARQEAYREALGLSSLYTPQMVVNGQWEFVGSDGYALSNALAAGLSTPVTVSVSVWPELDDIGNIDVRYEVVGAPAGSALQLVLVERDLSTAIPSGENAGTTLTGQNVVRQWIVAPTSTAELELDPGEVVLDDASLVGWVQSEEDMTISGATYLDLRDALADGL